MVNDRRDGISLTGGEQPRWRGDGEELFFAGGGKIMAVAVKGAAPFGSGAQPVFEAQEPQPLFDMRLFQSYNASLPEYDVTADGQRFLLTTVNGAAAASQLNVVVNWGTGLTK